MKRTLALLLSAMLLFALLAGCNMDKGGETTPATTTPGATEPAKPKPAGPSGSIKVIFKAIGNNLDPVLANYTDTSSMVYHIYDTILTIDADFNLLDGVCSLEQTDALTYKFTPKPLP